MPMPMSGFSDDDSDEIVRLAAPSGVRSHLLSVFPRVLPSDFAICPALEENGKANSGKTGPQVSVDKED
ncbi:hypothetical protein U1Q18_048455 [Sarracenia purpurea var. burkii]